MLGQNTILIVGDSISAGYGIDVNQGWVALLKQKLQENNYHYQVINDSISGDTTSNGLHRLPEALLAYHPMITIIELGGNDGLRGLPINVIAANINEMISISLNNKSKVLVLGVRIPPNYGEVYVQHFQQIYLDLKKQKNIRVVPAFLRGVDDKPELMQSDGIHPAQIAQPILLKNAWDELQPML